MKKRGSKAIFQSGTFFTTGGPGSGKGTQCDRICVKYGYTHMSSGDLLRNEVMSMTERGRKLYQLMANGEAVPNSVVDELLVEAMTSKKSSKVKAKKRDYLISHFILNRYYLLFPKAVFLCVMFYHFSSVFLCNILSPSSL